MFSGYFVAMALATLVGLSLGALGSGGSIITTPLLVYVAHIPPDKAVGMSLVIVGATSVVGAILQLRRGNMSIRPAILFSLTGMVGSFIGSTGTHLISKRILLLLFSSIMLVVAMAMWRGRAAYVRSKSVSVGQCLVAGFGVGLLTGFLGIGGGFLIVPALVFFAGLDARIAAGTSLAVIAFNCATGVIGQLRFVQIDWGLLAGFLLFSVGGMLAGTTLCGRLPEDRIRRIFAITVFVVGVAIGLTNLL